MKLRKYQIGSIAADPFQIYLQTDVMMRDCSLFSKIFRRKLKGKLKNRVKFDLQLALTYPFVPKD